MNHQSTLRCQNGIHCILCAIIGAACLLLSGCAKHDAESYFDTLIAGRRAPYILGGVSGYRVQSYHIENSTGSTIAVRITYLTKGGFDRQETKRFRIAGGRLRPLDKSGIEDQIRQNLDGAIFTAVGQYINTHPRDQKPITYASLVSGGFLDPSRIQTAADEDYSKIAVSFDPQGLLSSIALKYNGDEIVSRY